MSIQNHQLRCHEHDPDVCKKCLNVTISGYEKNIKYGITLNIIYMHVCKYILTLICMYALRDEFNIQKNNQLTEYLS